MKRQYLQTIIKVVSVFYFLCIANKLAAQSCHHYESGFMQTFGNGQNPGKSLPPGKTNYIYTADPCPAQGYYTIMNTVSRCFGNRWDSIYVCCSSSDVNGYMMIVNATANPGDVYIDTLSLCENSKYSFSISYANMTDAASCGGQPIRPQLRFTVETLTGVILNSYNTGDVVEVFNGAGEYELAFDFTTPSTGGTVIIRVADIKAGGCGNNFFLDDIFVTPCGPDIIAGLPNTAGILEDQLDLCLGKDTTLTLTATVSEGYQAPAFQWQMFNGTQWIDIPGATGIKYMLVPPAAIGFYKYRLVSAEAGNIGNVNCRVQSNEVKILVSDPAIVGKASSNSPVCINSPVNLSINGGKSYVWTGPDGFTSTVADPVLIATSASAGDYSVAITDGSGCKSKSVTTVITLDLPTVTVSDTKSICTGDFVTLQAGGGKSYSWSPADNLSSATVSNPVASPNTTTTYRVTVTGSNNCKDTASVTVVVNTKPIANAGEDKVTLKGQPVTLNGSIKNLNNINFSWSPPASLNNATLLQPDATPVINTNYVLTAMSTIGCGLSADTVSVKVFSGLYIPNAFSPNQDGLNDTWSIPGLQAYPEAVVSVYNRFGKKIFESRGGSKEWDGTYKNSLQPVGTYPYIIDLKNNKPIIKGVVIIVR